MGDYYAHIEDCEIVRPDSAWKSMRINGLARLCANDEEFSYFNFPESFTDEQIEIALMFANSAYERGVEIGKDRKADEIKKALGL